MPRIQRLYRVKHYWRMERNQQWWCVRITEANMRVMFWTTTSQSSAIYCKPATRRQMRDICNRKYSNRYSSNCHPSNRSKYSLGTWMVIPTTSTHPRAQYDTLPTHDLPYSRAQMLIDKITPTINTKRVHPILDNLAAMYRVHNRKIFNANPD